MYRENLIYNGIWGDHNNYIWPSLMVWQQDGENLINPNQCRDFGIPIFYYPTNKNSPLGIEADFNTHIPMLMMGSTCGFITWYPTDDNVETRRNIAISNEHDWDQSKHIFNISSM